MALRILVIEDDGETADHIVRGLADRAHEIAHTADGSTGLERARSEPWDLLIVDRMLPGLDGLTLIRTLRRETIQIPVLVLSTLGGIDDRVDGLEAGADDYLIKPFALVELVARVAALGRRSAVGQTVTTLRAADLELELLTRTVKRGGQLIDLQPREFQILEFLVRHTGHVVTRSMLLEAIWGFNFDPHTNVVESHISRLRSKVDRGQPELIHTIRNAGYMLRG